MIYDTSYSDKETTREIDNAVGKSFSFMERWRMAGIGSSRLVISDISEEYKKYLNAEHYISNANIELRPKGILLHFRHKLQVYSWVMPYETLKIEEGNEPRFISNDKFIQFKSGIEPKFLGKLKSLKEQSE